MENQNNTVKTPALWQALLPIGILVGLLTINAFVFDDALGGASQIALLFTASIASLIAIGLGNKWDRIQKVILENIDSSMPSMLILLLIGSLAGTWMLSGVVPAMIYYGLEIVTPRWFLVSAVVVSAVVSVSTGSSWSTIATIGIALLGIGRTLGFDEAVVAGAIISGAYFGDKMSPLSDTTNLAPAMAGTDLFTHIRYMFYTTVPSIIITLIIFLVMGFTGETTGEVNITDVQTAILERFTITPWLFLVPIVLITIIVKKVPAIPSLLIGTLLGGIFALIFQYDLVLEIGKAISLDASYSAYAGVMQAMFGDVAIVTSNESVNDLLNTSGMAGMLGTIWLILSAMVFGGVMDAAGFLKTITNSIIRFANGTTALISSTVGTCIFLNTTTSDQYIAIVVAGRMYKTTYKDKGLKPEVLSRTLEDSGTVVSVLVPWNTCGATQSRVLGVATLSYLPYCFFNLISPIMSIIVAAIDYKIRRYSDDKKELVD